MFAFLPAALLIASQAATPSLIPASTDGDLTGRWGMLQLLSSRAKVPFVGDGVTDTRAVILFDLTERGDRLSGEGEVCSLDVKARPSIVRPVLPDSFRKAVSRQTFSARLVRSAKGLRLLGDRQLGVVGAKLADPERDRMPADAEDARTEDTDRDGKPGMTMRVEGLFDIEIYLAQRQWSRVTGRQTSPGRFEGRVFHDAEQILLGADSILVQALPDMRPDNDASRFVLVRLPAHAGCEAAQGRLLPPAP